MGVRYKIWRAIQVQGSVVQTMEMIAKVRERKGRLGKTNIEGERDLMRI